MSRRNLALSGAIAGVTAAVLNLLVEWRLNHALVAADYLTSVALAVLTGLAIFILFRRRLG